MKIPFIDLEAQYREIKEEIHCAIDSVLESRKFIQGDIVNNFCSNFIKVHGGNYASGCSNGTSALTVALRALDIKAGDEIITVSNTFFATVEAIAEVGAKIILVDCDPETYSIDIEKMEAAITNRTRAIIPVHLYGNPAPIEAILKIAEKYNLKILEDCAQGHLATYKGQAIGTFGDAATFSFFPGKNLGAYGDAGLVLTKSSELKKRVSMHINHGRVGKYEHQFLAGNYRMDGIQAAVLDVKLKYLNQWTNQRIEAAKFYESRLVEAGFKTIKQLSDAKCVYHLYIVEISNRDHVMNRLKEREIDTGIHYPIPMHLQPALKHLEYQLGDFPVSEKSANRIISIPIYPEITHDQQNYVLEEFLKVAKI